MHLLFLIEQTKIAEKIKSSPDSAYQTGVLIGSFIPFVVLVGLAYWMYYYFKKNQKNE